MKIDRFVNQYSLSKTLRFRLKPVGATEENFNKKMLLQEDEERGENYKKAKHIIDEYHKVFIDDVLQNVRLQDIVEFSDLYYLNSKTDLEVKKMEECALKLRKQISNAFSKDCRFNKLFKSAMITELLPEFCDEDSRAIIEQFNDFWTYFQNFSINRMNMYTYEAKNTSIAYRSIDVNLAKFLDNIKSFKKILSVIPEQIKLVEENYMNIFDVRIERIFDVDSYSFFLPQENIKKYNELIGGIVSEDGSVIKGINQYVNLHNQKVDKKNRLPLLKPLFKQILSDAESHSFIPESFNCDQEVIDSIKDMYLGNSESIGVNTAINNMLKLFEEINTFDLEGIYIVNGSNITNLSQSIFGDWSVFSHAWEKAYDSTSKAKNKDTEKYYEERRKAYKAVKSFSLKDIITYGNSFTENNYDVCEYFKEKFVEIVNNVKEKYSSVLEVFERKYVSDNSLCKDNAAITKIKNFLDSIKDVENFAKTILGTGKEENKDDVFYGQFLPIYNDISVIRVLYDKVRNYITKKPFSNEKIKLNFENPQFLNGWAKNKERDYRTVILRKEELFYLAIIDKNDSKVLLDPHFDNNEDCYEKMVYEYTKDVTTTIPKCTTQVKEVKKHFENNSSEFVLNTKRFIKPITITKEVYELNNVTYEGFKKFQKGYLKSTGDISGYREALEIWIKFCMEFLNSYSSTSCFNYESILPANQYESLDVFYNDVNKLLYNITFDKVSSKYIDELVDSGKIYLYQIYCKDFSKCSKGVPNLHTLYFRMLFDNKNLCNVVYKLNGGAEMFYRKASIEKSRPEHPAGVPIDNKNPNNPKKQSVFRFDLYKDKRYMENQYYLHLPITINYKADNTYSINTEVRKSIKKCDNNYIIGIDRGERHLLYVSVIDNTGKIVEQYSLNQILSKNNDITCVTDYHRLLEDKEKGRKKARQDWTTIENIKELKEGYISQVVHKISELVVKYDAVVAMEDLNSGFKNSRKKVEKEVYQKFEKMLTEKLAFLVDKKIEVTEDGGLLNAYQLVNKPGNFDKLKQDGFIMYVPAWLTSNIDPITGFVDLLKPKSNMSIASAKEFFDKFDSIVFNSEMDVFEFKFNYDNFPRGSMVHKKEWTLCSHGERIINYRNKELNNNYDSKIINLTEEFKCLLSDYKISLDDDIKTSILQQNQKVFFERLIKLLSATLQLRNSKTGDGEVDYIISPVRDENGHFFDSRQKNADVVMPENADANGAYNIARKALFAIERIKAADETELDKLLIYPNNSEWLKYVQM